MTTNSDSPKWRLVDWLCFCVIALFCVWWRAHTFAPTLKQSIGLGIWPVVVRESEPLDCDEAAYAYIGNRLVAGDVMYRDITENKPPGGYWLYALAVKLGGYHELTIRLMPIPLVLATLAILWWIAHDIGGTLAASISTFTYVFMSTDPYVYGNGANLEHAMNLFSTAALACYVKSLIRPSQWLLLLCGAFVAAASLVKQVAVLNLGLFLVVLLFHHESWKSRLRQSAYLILGFLSLWLVAVGILIVQGAGSAAYDDIVRYGGALASETPSEPNAPPFLVRWITGNSDPRNGALPWPFGKTDWLVWWGTGCWPLWLTAIPVILWLGLKRGTSASRRVIAAWTVSAWLQVAMPGLFWQHYYMLPIPGVSLGFGIVFSELIFKVWSHFRSNRGWRSLGFPTLLSLVLASGLGWTLVIQTRDYLFVPAEDLTRLYKGGGQWIVLRDLGRELGRRARLWKSPHIYIWGYQSPILFYSGLDSVSRHFFVDPLLKSFAGTGHPLIRPRLDRILADLERSRPEIVFVGYPPFPRLLEFLQAGYLRSSLKVRGFSMPRTADGQGLYVEKSEFDAFERASENNVTDTASN